MQTEPDGVQKTRDDIDRWLSVAETEGCAVADALAPMWMDEISTIDLSGLKENAAEKQLDIWEGYAEVLAVFEMPPLPIEAAMGCTLDQARRERDELWPQYAGQYATEIEAVQNPCKECGGAARHKTGCPVGRTEGMRRCQPPAHVTGGWFQETNHK